MASERSHTGNQFSFSFKSFLHDKRNKKDLLFACLRWKGAAEFWGTVPSSSHIILDKTQKKNVYKPTQTPYIII